MDKFIITSEYAGERLDKMLSFMYPEYSRGFLQRLIRDGHVLVFDKPSEKKYILRERDIIKVSVPVAETYVLEPDPSVKPRVIYEDEDVVVVNKSAGVIVHPGEKREQGTLVAGMIARYPEMKNVGEDPLLRPGVVHRLDKDTSGVMIFARTQEAFEFLKKQFQDRKAEKVYWALVEGNLCGGRGETCLARTNVIKGYLKRSPKDPRRRVLYRDAGVPLAAPEGGKYSETEYEVIKKYWGRGVLQYAHTATQYARTLVEVKPKTGRMHQIRAHFKSIGHPLVGDEVYGHADPDLGRHFLHAKSLKIALPSGEEKIFEAELPSELDKYLENLSEK